MIPLVTAEQMRRIDQAAIAGGIESLDLMEAAGKGVAEAVDAHFGGVEGRTVLIVCGKGNNGGDGFVAARYLNERGAQPAVVALGGNADLSPDARTNADRWQAAGGTILHLESEAEVTQFMGQAPDVQVIIDAMLGTGSSGAPRGTVAAAVRGLRGLGRPIVAVDVPTGIDSDSGCIPGDALHADLTVSLGLPKRGHYLYPARRHVGILEVVDIGIPDDVVADADVPDLLIEAGDVPGLLPAWSGDAHKGDRGRLLVLGGSAGLTGAVAMAAGAALRAGAGLVTAGVPASLNDIMEVKLTEAMTLALPEGPERRLEAAAFEPVSAFAGNRLTAMVLGPGMGRAAGTGELVRRVVAGVDSAKVLDADGLHAFRDDPKALTRDRTAGPVILTPHPGEAEWILGRPAAEIAADRINLAGQWAREHGQVLVLKGAPTVIGSPEGETFTNPSGGPSLATGGTGDVLAGMIGAFLAQGLTPIRAAICAVYLHGFTADLITERRSPYGLIATDLVEALPEALGEIFGETA